MFPSGSRLTVSLLALATLATALCGGSGLTGQAMARDSTGTGLALRHGATLAPARVLDIGSTPAAVTRVVGSHDGTERRRDTTGEVRFELQAEVLFAKDSARLSVSARSRIASVARAIVQQQAMSIRIAGFTDSLGSSEHGEALSKRRADAVKSVLSAELHATAVAFETHGFGERYPVASNATEQGRQKNRRVEVSFPRTGS
ncbi:OmpA family protein [Streptomyces sp. DH10]|uniref:OmpA family protein n=1 Tax=Streptomyces sp. DH10 TaxID=3040121 RepID=UPI0024414504|nr:OmpA family protein [Streptomyces sp. DH10]MDG9709735.1 OmpA family protein [Streptomyces sp. DH10]